MGGRLGIAFAFAATLTGPGCSALVFECETTDDCAGRPGGSCEASGHCSFPDETCPSGRRYGEFAPPTFSEVCVDLDPATSTSDASASGSGSGSGSGSTGTTTFMPGSGPAESSTSGTAGLTDGSSTSAVTATATATASGTTGSVTDGTGGSESTRGAESSSGVQPTVTIVLSASVAECTDPVANDPAACELSTLTQGMSVDASNNGTKLTSTTAFVAFELSPGPAGSELLAAELRLTTTDEPNAESMTQTGEIWQTTAFTEASLSMGQPTLVGDMPMAADQGGAAASELVVWTLPIAEIDLSGSLFLAVVPTTPEGVDYWNAMGAAPPELVLEFSGD